MDTHPFECINCGNTGRVTASPVYAQRCPRCHRAIGILTFEVGGWTFTASTEKDIARVLLHEANGHGDIVFDTSKKGLSRLLQKLRTRQHVYQMVQKQRRGEPIHGWEKEVEAFKRGK